MNRLGIRVRASDVEVAYARLEPLLDAGVEEVELDDTVELAVYGDALPSDDEVRALAGDTLVSLVRSSVDSDWAVAWQQHLAPVQAGGFVIRPPWLEGGPEDLVIDPGPSFGAASHPTTRLCLSLLRELPRTALADWGTGSGVLAIAGARLGFSPVVAIELDVAAAHVARRNAARNGVDVEVVVGDALESPAWAPTVVANLTLPLLVGGASRTLIGDEGSLRTLVASGVIAAQADDAADAWAARGFAERDRRELEGWAALVLERA